MKLLMNCHNRVTWPALKERQLEGSKASLYPDNEDILLSGTTKDKIQTRDFAITILAVACVLCTGHHE